MIYVIAGYVSAFSLAVLGYCGLWIYDYIRERTEARKAAAKALTQRKVHDEWAVERNRRELWWDMLWQRRF